jgi:hypothetical protein
LNEIGMLVKSRALQSMFPDECGIQSLFPSNPVQQVPEQKITEASKVTKASKIEDEIMDPTRQTRTHLVLP